VKWLLVMSRVGGKAMPQVHHHNLGSWCQVFDKILRQSYEFCTS